MRGRWKAIKVRVRVRVWFRVWVWVWGRREATPPLSFMALGEAGRHLGEKALPRDPPQAEQRLELRRAQLAVVDAAIAPRGFLHLLSHGLRGGRTGLPRGSLAIMRTATG